jgi:hypothetical protein
LRKENPGYANRQQQNVRNWLRNLTPERLAELKGYRARRGRGLRANPAERRKERTARLLRKYGITANEYDAMLAAQGGGCAVCERKPGKTPHHVDHDHATRRVRGILCHQCNWYVGTIDADPGVLDRLRNYLADTKG